MRINVPVRGNRKLRTLVERVNEDRQLKGVVARRERQRRRPHGDQRPLVGAHPDRHEHRAQAPPPADEARHRAVARPRLRHDERRRRGRRRPRRAPALHRHGGAPRGPRGLLPLPRRAEDARAARRALRGAGPDGDHVGGAAGDHEPPRVRQAADDRGRDRARRRRARHGEGPLAHPVRARLASRSTRSRPRRSRTSRSRTARSGRS